MGNIFRIDANSILENWKLCWVVRIHLPKFTPIHGRVNFYSTCMWFQFQPFRGIIEILFSFKNTVVNTVIAVEASVTWLKGSTFVRSINIDRNFKHVKRNIVTSSLQYFTRTSLLVKTVFILFSLSYHAMNSSRCLHFILSMSKNSILGNSSTEPIFSGVLK